MRNVLVVSALLLAPVPALAQSLTCTLHSLNKFVSIAYDLNYPPREPPQSRWLYDLSIVIEASCEKKPDCRAEITYLSRTDEDEAGNQSFEFSLLREDGQVYSAPFTRSPDHRRYQLICTQRK